MKFKKGVKTLDSMDLYNDLKSLGYGCGNGDGVYDKDMESAVFAFQSAQGLTASGMADEATLERIINIKATANKSAVDYKSLFDTAVLSVNIKSNQIAVLEEQLRMKNDVEQNLRAQIVVLENKILSIRNALTLLKNIEV